MPQKYGKKNKKKHELEKIHLHFIKSNLRIKQSTSTMAVYAETGRFPIELKQKVQIIKYWKRLLELPEENILKQAYESLYQTCNLGQNNWCQIVKNILTVLDMNHIWDLQNIEYRDIHNVKGNLHTNFMKLGIENISNSEKLPKLRTYKLFKTRI